MSKTIIKNIKKAITEIYNIIDAINDNIPDATIYDSYEEYNKKMLDFIKLKGKLWFDKFFDAIMDNIYENVGNNTIIEDLYKLPNINKHLLDHIIYIIFNQETNTESDTENETEDIVSLQETITNFRWRKNQTDAINEVLKQNFKSGIHNQVMGAGKTFIIWKQIDEHYKKNKKSKLYIITCNRQEILKELLFDETGGVDNNKKIFLRENKIINIDDYKIINRVHSKKKSIEIDELMPTVLFINTDFLRVLHNANTIDYTRVSFITVDECHAVSAPILYKILRKIKYDNKISIIGFSATPLRQKAEKKLIDIFSATVIDKDMNKKLNIISNYDFITAIRDDVILPPYYILSEVSKTIGDKIGKDNKNIMKTVLKNALENAPYKKIIGWCRTIDQMVAYYKFIKENFPELDIYCSSCQDGHKKMKECNINWHEYINKDKNCILLCVNRFREGSDILHLDTAIYLDIVKKRSILVGLQTSGRVLRKDKENKKVNGIVIDSFVNTDKEQVEVITAEKIINYYKHLFTLCDDTSYLEQKEAYTQMLSVCTNMTYDEKEETLIFKIDDKKQHDIKCKLILKTKTYDFNKLKLQVGAIIDNMYKMKKEDKFNIIIDKIKALEIFKQDVNFWDEYAKLDHITLNILDTQTLKETFRDIWQTKTWYEVLGTNDKMSYDKLQSMLNKKFPEYETITEKIYNSLYVKNYKLPKYPLEYYRLDNVQNYKDLKR